MRYITTICKITQYLISGSCSYTNKEAINFWEVDLEKEYFIDHIKVLGRNDYNAGRINGATVS
jgi:hypothetical protein